MSGKRESLEAILGRGRLPRRKALSFAVQIARHLESARQAGRSFILHPEGVYIEDDKVLVTKSRVPDDRYWVRAIVMFGRILYAMLTGDQPSDARYDQWQPDARAVPGQLGAIILDCLNYSQTQPGGYGFPESHLRDFGDVAPALEALQDRQTLTARLGDIALALENALRTQGVFDYALEVAFIAAVLTFGAAISFNFFPTAGTLWSPSPSPGPTGPPPRFPVPTGPRRTSTLERLFSAAWLTDSNASPGDVDISDKASPYLRVGEPYLLKFALRDSAFPRPPGVETPSSSEQIVRAPSQALRPGVELDADYFSADLEPPRAAVKIRVPASGEPSVVAFPVTPAAVAREGIQIFLRLQLKDLPFYQTTLRPAVFGRDEIPPETPKRVWSSGESDVDADTANSYQPRQAGEVEILLTPVDHLDRAQYGIQITWEGHAWVDGRLGLKGTELKDKMKIVREDLEAIGANAVFKKELDDEDIGNAGIRKALLLKLAAIGHRLYSDLFTDAKIRKILLDIKEYSKTHQPLRVDIRHATDINDPDRPARVILPFGLLYDDPDFDPEDAEKNTVDISNFWDYRYLVAFTEREMMWHKRVLCPGGIVRLAAALDVGTANVSTGKGWKAQVDEQVQFLKLLQKRFQTDWIPDEESFRNLFSRQAADHDIIYYYGHTNNGSRPSFNLTSGAPLGLDALKQHISSNRLTTLKEYPLIILNSCKGAAFDGDNYNSFLDLMASVQAGAFIGTEASIGIPFGARIGQRLLDGFGSKATDKTIVQVMWELKRAALDRSTGNPLILLYSLYGDPFLRTCPV